MSNQACVTGRSVNRVPASEQKPASRKMGASLPNAADPVNSMSNRTRKLSVRPCGRDGLWQTGAEQADKAPSCQSREARIACILSRTGKDGRGWGPGICTCRGSASLPVMLDLEREGPVSWRLADQLALALQPRAEATGLGPKARRLTCRGSRSSRSISVRSPSSDNLRGEPSG